MSDDNVQSEQNASRPSGGDLHRPNNLVLGWKRLIVWGFIGVLLLVAVVEGHARLAYMWTGSSLKNALEKDKQGEEVSVAQLDGLVKGFPSKSKIVKKDNVFLVDYEWKSIFRSGQYKITVSLSSDQADAVVFGYTTPDPEDEPVLRSTPGDEEGDEGDEGGEDPMGGDIAGGGPPASHEAQAPGGGGGGGRGTGGGRGGSRPRGMAGQLADAAVQAELKITDEQKSKIEELPRPDFSGFREMSPEEQTAFRKQSRQKTEDGIKGILDDEQFVRVRQLTLRATGIRAIGQSDVQVELKFSQEQEEKLGKLLEEYSAARRELGREASAEEREELAEEWNAKILGALSDDQKAAWEMLLGDPPVKTEATDSPPVEAEITDSPPTNAEKPEAKKE